MTNTTRVIVPNIFTMLFVILENLSVYLPIEYAMPIKIKDIINMVPNILYKAI